MDSVITNVVIIIVTFFLVIIVMIIGNSEDSKTTVYQISRVVNYDAISDYLEQDNNDENIMIEEWLKNLSLFKDKKINELEVTFYYLNTSPPCYVVSVKDYSTHLVISEKSYQKIISSITILE